VTAARPSASPVLRCAQFCAYQIWLAIQSIVKAIVQTVVILGDFTGLKAPGIDQVRRIVSNVFVQVNSAPKATWVFRNEPARGGVVVSGAVVRCKRGRWGRTTLRVQLSAC